MTYSAQYKFIAEHRDRYNKYARDHYHRVRADPKRSAQRGAKRKEWYDKNKPTILEKQRLKKRERKLKAIEYLGGLCFSCNQSYHPAVFEFHHRDPSLKDKDPSKLLSAKWERVLEELDKCDLLCANCHRLAHHAESDD